MIERTSLFTFHSTFLAYLAQGDLFQLQDCNIFSSDVSSPDFSPRHRIRPHLVV